jgi:hypothetical protein
VVGLCDARLAHRSLHIRECGYAYLFNSLTLEELFFLAMDQHDNAESVCGTSGAELLILETR